MFYLFLFLVIILIYYWVVKRSKKAHEILNAWANENHYEITEKKYCFFRGPFNFSGNQFQMVYYLEIIDNGNKRKCYVMLGSYLFGLLDSDKIKIFWDE
jgi:hypothetical protein